MSEFKTGTQDGKPLLNENTNFSDRVSEIPSTEAFQEAHIKVLEEEITKLHSDLNAAIKLFKDVFIVVDDERIEYLIDEFLNKHKQD